MLFPLPLFDLQTVEATCTIVERKQGQAVASTRAMIPKENCLTFDFLNGPAFYHNPSFTRLSIDKNISCLVNPTDLKNEETIDYDVAVLILYYN